MIELTEQQWRAVGSGDSRVRDPQTGETYVHVKAAVYERLRTLLDDDMPEVSAHVNEVMAEDDAGDPFLEEYQHYRDVP